MRIEVFTTHSPPAHPHLRAQMESRLARALGRFEARLRRVAMTLADDNGDKGGADDKICRLEVELAAGQGYVRVESRDETLSRAATKALRRVRRAIAERARSPMQAGRRRVTAGMSLGR